MTAAARGMCRTVALGAALLLATANSALAGSETEAPLAQGERMIARCLDYAAAHQYPPMSAGVVDPTGTLIAFKRQDGAAPATAEAALLKARTSLRVGAPTAALGEVSADPSTRDTFLVLQLTTLPGGIPFPGSNGLLAGAFGVSGGAPDQDAECARQAIDGHPAKK